MRSRERHGMHNSPTYSSWTHMKGRCKSTHAYCRKYYLDRGIDYDPRWELFTNFLADMGERPKGKSLDRIDNDRGYWPDNCRWASPKQQVRNRRNTPDPVYCKRNHKWADGNLYIDKRGAWNCRRCRADRMIEVRRKERAMR